ncbi:MAG TPA: hypothetical protein VI564_01540 [Candidatus Nanoarchaeia archaeon]|nr:hypothetical protein [Candidatus Nanoarchaeia archaeon]
MKYSQKNLDELWNIIEKGHTERDGITGLIEGPFSLHHVQFDRAYKEIIRIERDFVSADTSSDLEIVIALLRNSHHISHHLSCIFSEITDPTLSVYYSKNGESGRRAIAIPGVTYKF